MKLQVSLEKAFTLAYEFGRQILTLEFRSEQKHLSTPKMNVVVHNLDDEYGKGDYSILMQVSEGSSEPLTKELSTTDGYGKNLPDAMATLMYTCRLEIEERIAKHQELLSKLIEACPIYGDPGYIVPEEQNNAKP